MSGFSVSSRVTTPFCLAFFIFCAEGFATRAIGGIGFVIQSDVDRMSAEVGYWLGEAFWGRGIVTEALVAVTSHAARTVS